MGKYAYCLMALLILIKTSFALRCYVCDSYTIDGCIKEAKPKNYTCGSKMSYFRQVCAYTVLYDTEKELYKVHSGCELINEKDPVATSKVRECIDTPNNINVVECRVCDQDVCNSANSKNIYLFIYLFVTYSICAFVIN